MSKTQLIKLTIALGGGALVALAGLGGSYIVPLDNEAIQYARARRTIRLRGFKQGSNPAM